MATVIGVLLVPMLFVFIEKISHRGGKGGDATTSTSSTTHATGTHG
jgi:hypothetical protein